MSSLPLCVGRILSLLALLVMASVAQAQVPAALPWPNVALRSTGEVSSMARQPDGSAPLVGDAAASMAS